MLCASVTISIAATPSRLLSVIGLGLITWPSPRQQSLITALASDSRPQSTLPGMD